MGNNIKFGDMAELAPSQKLDIILNILFDNANSLNTVVTFASIDQFLKGKLTLNEIQLVLQKLIKDEYAEANLSGSVEVYQITFEGLVLYESGGYHHKFISDDLNERRIVRNETWLLRGTWAAAIIGVSVLLWNILIWFYPHYCDFPYILFGKK